MHQLASSSILFVDNQCDPLAARQHKLIVPVIEVALLVLFGLGRGILLERLSGFRVAGNATFVGEFADVTKGINVAISASSDAVYADGFLLKAAVLGLVAPCNATIIILHCVPIQHGDARRFTTIFEDHPWFFFFCNLEFSG